jgi:hypothetical protein
VRGPLASSYDRRAELRRIYIPGTVKKGCEQRSNAKFGRYREGEMGRKAPSRQSTIGLRYRRVRGFSDTVSLGTSGACALEKTL